MVAIAYTVAHETELVNTGSLHVREIQGDITFELWSYFHQPIKTLCYLFMFRDILFTAYCFISIKAL